MTKRIDIFLTQTVASRRNRKVTIKATPFAERNVEIEGFWGGFEQDISNWGLVIGNWGLGDDFKTWVAVLGNFNDSGFVKEIFEESL